MEIQQVFKTDKGIFSATGKSLSAHNSDFSRAMNDAMDSKRAKEIPKQNLEQDLNARLKNPEGSFCQSLEKTGVYVYHEWISKEQEVEIQSEIGRLRDKEPLTAEDIGKVLEKNGIHFGYLTDKCWNESSLNGQLEWVPLSEETLDEFLRAVKKD